MVSMQQYELIRLRCLRDGEPIKKVARDLGLAPNTIRKYLRSTGGPKELRYERSTKLGPLVGVIDDLIRSTPKITATRVGTILREQYDANLIIGESQLRKVVANRRKSINPGEVFVRAHYMPGQVAEFDFTPVTIMLAGILTVIQIFAMRLNYSGHFYARASHRVDRPAIFEGLLGAVQAFGGLMHTAVFDNPKTAVDKVLRGREREQNPVFAAFCGDLTLGVEFAAPRKGNEKGGVEGLMGYIEDNIFRPLSSYETLEEVNADLDRLALINLDRIHSTHRERIGDRFLREQAVLRPLPQHLPRPCVIEYALVNKFAEVTVGTNRYSVPGRFARQHATVEVFDRRIVILVGGKMAAEHPRAVGNRQMMIDPMHVIDVIDKKHRSALRALAFAEGRLPAPLLRLRERLIERDGPQATKAWTSVLKLAKTYSLADVAEVVEAALARGTFSPTEILFMMRQRDRSIAPLELGEHREMPACSAQVIDLSAYRIEHLIEVA